MIGAGREKWGKILSMHGLKANWIVFVLAFWLSACAGRPAPAPTLAPTQLPVPTALPSATAAPAPTSTRVLVAPYTRYTLHAVLDYASHQLAVEEQILYTNHSSDPLSELLLVVEPAYYPDAFTLISLNGPDGQPIQNLSWEKTWLHMPLAAMLQPGESLRLDLAYQFVLPERVQADGLRPMVIGWSERQTNLVDWYVTVAPYEPGKGWIAHKPGYYGEHQVYESADFDITLQVTGQTGLTVAASAPDSPQGDRHHYQLEAARTFAVSIGADYQVSTRQVGDVTLTAYTFPYHAAAGEQALQSSAEALELYSRIFAPYPHKSLAVVEADFLDGMEYDGLYFLSNGFYNLNNGRPDQYLVALAAHETAHQWWFGLVGNDQAMEPWLDEALCTYSEKLFYDQLHPEALTWWWAVRVNYYQPHGWVDDSIYNPHGDPEPYRAYRDAVYLNGAIFLDQLRSAVGDEAFFAFLHDYAAQNTHHLATGDSFFAILKSHTQVDLSGLVKKFFSQR